MAIEAGQVVLFVSPTASWSYGTAREVVGSGVRVESYLDDGQDSNGVENVVPLEAVYPIADSSVLEEEPDDLLDLTDGHEGVLLQSLRKRFSHDVVYTAIANDIVVYINPSNEKIPWYQPSEMARYVGMTDLRRLMPHTWSLGCSAYRSILTDGRNQTLLFTGDIGSGKTCAMRSVARLILEEAADKTAVAPPPRPGSAPARPLRAVFETVRQGAVLLEAFGCAKVKGSASSTRYCHMTRYYFEPTGRLVGVHCDAFNLDRSRAAQPAAAGERTFHSFYQLLASKDGAKLFSLHLGADERRDHLGGGDWEADAAALAGAWKETNNAMRAVGIKEAEGWSCWAVVAGILHLSSVRFVDEPSAETGEFAVVVAPDTSKYLRLAAYAFGVPLPRLQQALLYMDDLARNRTVEECASAKAVLCTTLYARMFQWLVARVNAATDVDFDMTSIDGLRSIALLDSTGFESPASGSFEHLCNNTVNEVLQNHYNACVLAADVAECRAENLFAEPAAFYDNSGAVDLLCNENGGLLALIDSHSKANASDDEGLARKMARAHECNSSFRADVLRPLLVNVGHYAGEVAYNLAGWGTTGTAEAADALAAAFGQSKDKVVAGLFASPDENDGLTVAAALRHKLAAVMEAVGSSVPRWVRCIKPNADGRPAAFDGNLVMAQLKSSAVPETTRLRRSGFPARLSKRDFVARFRCLLRAPEGKGSLASQCCAILDRLRLTNFDAQIGSSKVFLKVAVLAALEAGRIEALKEHAVVLQRYALFALAKSEKAAAVLRSNEGLLKGIAAKLQLRAALVKTHDRSRGAVVEKEDEARLVLRRDVVAGWHALEDSLWQEKVRDAEAKAHRERKRKEEQKKRNLRMILEREHAETARQKHLDRLKAAELVLKQEKAAAGGQRPASASKDLPVELARSALMGAAAPLLGADRGDRSNAGVGFEALVQQKTQSELARRVHDLEQAQKKQEAAEKQRQRELKARMKHTARCHEEEQERLRSFSDNERKRRVGAASCRVLKQSGVTDERLQKARQRREGLLMAKEEVRLGRQRIEAWQAAERDFWKTTIGTACQAVSQNARRENLLATAAARGDSAERAREANRAQYDALRGHMLRDDLLDAAVRSEAVVNAEKRRKTEDRSRAMKSAESFVLRVRSRSQQELTRCQLSGASSRVRSATSGGTSPRTANRAHDSISKPVLSSVPEPAVEPSIPTSHRVSLTARFKSAPPSSPPPRFPQPCLAAAAAGGAGGAGAGAASAHGKKVPAIKPEAYNRLLGGAGERDGLFVVSALHANPLARSMVHVSSARTVQWKPA